MEIERKLSPAEEKTIQDFIFDLAMIDGPEDMFPPDDGDREPRNPAPPSGSMSGRIALAAVYDLTAFRTHQRNIPAILGRC